MVETFSFIHRPDQAKPIYIYWCSYILHSDTHDQLLYRSNCDYTLPTGLVCRGLEVHSKTSTSKQSHSKRELSEISVTSRSSNDKRCVVSMQDDEVLSDNRANAADFFNFCLPTSQPSKSKGISSISAL